MEYKKSIEEIKRLEANLMSWRNAWGQLIIHILNDAWPDYVYFFDLEDRVVKLALEELYQWRERWIIKVGIFISGGARFFRNDIFQSVLDELVENGVVENREGYIGFRSEDS